VQHSKTSGFAFGKQLIILIMRKSFLFHNLLTISAT